MTNKVSKVTSIRKKFVQPGFIFSASYILFSADSCFGLARDALKQQQAVAHEGKHGVLESTSDGKTNKTNTRIDGHPKNSVEPGSTKPSFSQPAGGAAQQAPTTVVPPQAKTANRGGTGDSLKNNATEGTNGGHANTVNGQQPVPVENLGPTTENSSFGSHANSVDGQQPVPIENLGPTAENPGLTAGSPSLEHTLVGKDSLGGCPTNKVLSEGTCNGPLNCLNKEETVLLNGNKQKQSLNQPFQEEDHTDSVVFTQLSNSELGTSDNSALLAGQQDVHYQSLGINKQASVDKVLLEGTCDGQSNSQESVSMTGNTARESVQDEHSSGSGIASQGASTGAIPPPPPPPPPMPEGPLTLPMASFNVKKATQSSGSGQSSTSCTGKPNDKNTLRERDQFDIEELQKAALRRKIKLGIQDYEVESKNTADGQSNSLNRKNSMPTTGNTERESSQNGHSAHSAQPPNPMEPITYQAGSIPPPPPPPPSSNVKENTASLGSGKSPIAASKPAVHNITDDNVSMDKGQKQGTAPGGISNALQQSPFFQRKQSQLNDGSVSQENDASH